MVALLLLLPSVWLLSSSLAQDTVRNQVIPFPETGFVCSGRVPGFYADDHLLSNCRIYHQCSGRGGKSSFHCPNGTAFHQQFLICAHAHEVNCSMATKFYHVNNNIFPATKSPSRFLKTTPVQFLNTPKTVQQPNNLSPTTKLTTVSKDQTSLQQTQRTVALSRPLTVRGTDRNSPNTLQQTFGTSIKPLPNRIAVPFRNERNTVQQARPTASPTQWPSVVSATLPSRHDQNNIQQEDSLDELLVPSPARRRHLSTPKTVDVQAPQRLSLVTTTRRIDAPTTQPRLLPLPKLIRPLQTFTTSTERQATAFKTSSKLAIPPSHRLPIPPSMITMLEKQMRDSRPSARTSLTTSESLDSAASRWRLPVHRQEAAVPGPTSAIPKATQTVSRPHQPFTTPTRKLPLNLPIQRQPSSFPVSLIGSQQSDVVPDKNSFTEKYEEFRTTIQPNSIRPIPSNHWTTSHPAIPQPSKAIPSFPKNSIVSESNEWVSHLTMKFPKKTKVINNNLAINPSCPLCDPFYLDPGKCTPCIIIRR